MAQGISDNKVQQDITFFNKEKKVKQNVEWELQDGKEVEIVHYCQAR